ncbi:MAG: hypothetical protein NC453_16655 [Muribaculum sp.]|nr:hypothetical protein [Muribaculum sp.]
MKKSTPKKKRLELFHRNFDGEAFDKIKLSIQKVIKETSGVMTLMSRLKEIESVNYVEFSEDDDLTDQDFEPDYVSSEEDACDFLPIFCFAELDRSHMETDYQYVEVCFVVVYNDVQSRGWIDAAWLATADNDEDAAEKLCFFDIDTHEPTAWCSDLDKEDDN